PDINPIEQVWHELKTIIRQLPHPPSTVQELQTAVLAAWEQLPLKQIQKHMWTMPERAKAVKATKGGHTRY
ncbi:hypothetical protein FA15DRAFT_549923, partial [Coprinopsis marcescibilis]